MESITRINAELERTVSPHLMTEKSVESCWSQARQLKGDGPSYWLLLVRLTEAALLCAGNYADNCEYEAAGDFLVNPREILVHRRGDGRSTTKNRHGRLSEQFGLEGVERLRSMKRFSAGVCLEITKPPLLPHMTQVLRESELHIPGVLFSGWRKVNAELRTRWHFWPRGAFSIQRNFGGDCRHRQPGKGSLQNRTCAGSMHRFSIGSGRICGEAWRSRITGVRFWLSRIWVKTG